MVTNSDTPGMPPAETQRLVELVEYAAQAIVSRTLMKQPAGSMTLFAFDKAQSLSEHTTPFDALVQVIDGHGEFVIGGEQMRLGPGEVVLMPGDVPHAVHAPERFKMLLTMLRGEQS